ncbi:MAG TPA: hypothetical protein PKK68_07975 [Methanothrix soehngenii]|nr:hypothetical protein [Methanothrix soehngenii]
MGGATREAIVKDANDAEHIETEDDGFAEGIIKGLHDFKEGRFTRLKTLEELAEHFRNL